MKARFIGDPNNDGDGPKVLTLFGRQFPKDRFVTIEGEDADAVLGKLSANDHFEVEEGEGDVALPAAAPARGSFDRDHNGKSGGGRKKAAIVADLEALQARFPDVAFDPKMNAAALEAHLEELKFELGED